MKSQRLPDDFRHCQIIRQMSIERLQYRLVSQIWSIVGETDHLTCGVNPLICSTGEIGRNGKSNNFCECLLQLTLNRSLTLLPLRTKERLSVVRNCQLDDLSRCSTIRSFGTATASSADYSTNSISAIGAPSPRRGSSFEIRV